MTLNSTAAAPITNGLPPREGWQLRLRDYRCMKCARLLFRGYVIRGTVIEVKCGRCAKLNPIEGLEVKREKVSDGNIQEG